MKVNLKRVHFFSAFKSALVVLLQLIDDFLQTLEIVRGGGYNEYA